MHALDDLRKGTSVVECFPYVGQGSFPDCEVTNQSLGEITIFWIVGC
jgi:hypothetical protein